METKKPLKQTIINHHQSSLNHQIPYEIPEKLPLKSSGKSPWKSPPELTGRSPAAGPDHKKELGPTRHVPQAVDGEREARSVGCHDMGMGQNWVPLRIHG